MLLLTKSTLPVRWISPLFGIQQPTMVCLKMIIFVFMVTFSRAVAYDKIYGVFAPFFKFNIVIFLLF
jgi:hypothetical protein